ncbi:hypothetical protein ACFLZ7_03130 [Nanoarchaeota archaeon]
MKYALYILTVLVLVNIALASPGLTTQDSRPKIEALFNESVNLEAYSLTSLKTSQEVPLKPLSSTERYFEFQPNSSLYNGYYDFVVHAYDLIGNMETFQQQILVNATQTQIFLDSPRTGYSIIEDFDIVVGTTKPSDCLYSFFGPPSAEFDDVTFSKTRHTKEGYHLEDKSSRAFYVNCTDNESLSYYKEFELGVLKDPPVIKSTEAIPDVVVIAPPITTLRVETSQETVCTADGSYFDGQVWNNRGTYRIVSTKLLELSDNSNQYDQTVNIRCENLAELSTTAQISFSVDLEAEFQISNIGSPKQYVSNIEQLTLNITTNRDAICFYKRVGGDFIEMGRDDSALKHFTRLGVLEAAAHTLAISCTSGEGDEDDAIHRFIVDGTGPDMLDVSGFACDDDEFEAVFSAHDNESGIEGYNYTLSGGFPNTIEVNGYSTEESAVIEDLNLSRSAQYSLTVFALNRAGLKGESMSVSGELYDPNQTECLEKDPPSTWINKSITGYGVEVSIFCEDESGCDPFSYKYGVALEGTNCSASNSGDNAIVSSTSQFCWQVSDRIGNTAYAKELIQVGSFGNTCYNLLKDGDETDIDCGGSCESCELGSSCSLSVDCLSNYCVSGICEQASCTDNLTNGFESDIDCGGSICDGCDIGQACTEHPDCGSNYCVNSTCIESSCTDGVKNGLETDTDCGGSSCETCLSGQSCKTNSDCDSGTCEFFTCSKKELTWEEWAISNNIDPDDRNGDTDGDGLSNFDEFTHKTDPNNSDTDGDGYLDGNEVDKGTNPLDEFDFPEVSGLWRIILLVLGIIVLIVGLTFMYYFKTDKQTSLNLLLLGGAAILLALFDFVIQLPGYVPAALSVALLGGAGYFIYTRYDELVKFFKPAPKAAPIPSSVQRQGAKPAPGAPQKARAPPIRSPATRNMLDVIRKQKREREERRKKLFGQFDVKQSEKAKLKSIGKISLKPIHKIVKKARAAKEPEDVFAKLAKLTKRDEFSKLAKLLEKKPDEAFARLSALLKQRDVFRRLPKTDKDIASLLSRKPIKKLRKIARRKKK